jgi:hypothetical protein
MFVRWWIQTILDSHDCANRQNNANLQQLIMPLWFCNHALMSVTFLAQCYQIQSNNLGILVNLWFFLKSRHTRRYILQNWKQLCYHLIDWFIIMLHKIFSRNKIGIQHVRYLRISQIIFKDILHITLKCYRLYLTCTYATNHIEMSESVCEVFKHIWHLEMWLSVCDT